MIKGFGELVYEEGEYLPPIFQKVAKKFGALNDQKDEFKYEFDEVPKFMTVKKEVSSDKA